MAFRVVVLREYAMSVGVDDEECSDRVQRQVHRNARSREYQARLLIAFWKKKKEKAAAMQQQQQMHGMEEHVGHHPTGASGLPRRPVMAVSPRAQVSSWAAPWMREYSLLVRGGWMEADVCVADPTMQPSPASVEATLQVPARGSPGLFGPKSSDGGDSMYARM